MSAIFPKWTNRLPLMIISGGGLVASAVLGGTWYYATPKYTRVGYAPVQPVPLPAIELVDLGRHLEVAFFAVDRGEALAVVDSHAPPGVGLVEYLGGDYREGTCHRPRAQLQHVHRDGCGRGRQ